MLDAKTQCAKVSPFSTKDLWIPLSKAPSPALWTAFDECRDKLAQLTVEIEVLQAQKRLIIDELESRDEIGRFHE